MVLSSFCWPDCSVKPWCHWLEMSLVRFNPSIVIVYILYTKYTKSSYSKGDFLCVTFRYFTNQELRDLFTLDDPYTSTTQMQLEQMHAHHRNTDAELDKHIEFIHTLSKLLCWLLSVITNSARLYLFIWLKRILRSDWLPKRARCPSQGFRRKKFSFFFFQRKRQVT